MTTRDTPSSSSVPSARTVPRPVVYSARRPLIVAEDAEIVGTEVYLRSEIDPILTALAEIEKRSQTHADAAASYNRMLKDQEADNEILRTALADKETENERLRTLLRAEGPDATPASPVLREHLNGR